LGVGNAGLLIYKCSGSDKDKMARNIEIKARANDFQRQAAIASKLADGEPQLLDQEDTFFCVPNGRLKLREFGDGSGELIQYHRANTLEPTESRYYRVDADDPSKLKQVLTDALGVRAVVRKKRTVYLVGQTRIHLDEVEGLGEFIELEVVLRADQDTAYGAPIAEDLMTRLEIAPADLIKSAYIDLLE
jgi:predicted adenylyl cyclase CyaB